VCNPWWLTQRTHFWVFQPLPWIFIQLFWFDLSLALRFLPSTSFKTPLFQLCISDRSLLSTFHQLALIAPKLFSPAVTFLHPLSIATNSSLSIKLLLIREPFDTYYKPTHSFWDSSSYHSSSLSIDSLLPWLSTAPHSYSAASTSTHPLCSPPRVWLSVPISAPASPSESYPWSLSPSPGQLSTPPF
jgi:hypothetical protein